MNLPEIEGIPYTKESSEIGLFRNTTREFIKDKFPQYIIDAKKDLKKFPVEFMKECARVGFLGMEIPEEYGGNQVSPLVQAAVMEELARGDAGLTLNVLVANSLTAYPIVRFGSGMQRKKYLPRLASGEIFGCFAVTEPDTGSDAKAITTKAEEVENGWKINGTKRFITGANGADIMLLAARSGTLQDRGKGISIFLSQIDKGQKSGVSIPVIYDKLGQPGSQLCEVVFEDFFVPKDALLGEINKGWSVIENTFSHSRVWIAAQASGVAMKALDEALNYADVREQFGVKINQLPDLKNHLQIIQRQVDIARLLVKKAAWHESLDDEKSFVWASLAKLIASDTAFWAAGECMLAHGGMGYTKEMPISQILADSPVLRIYEGTSHIQINILDKHLKRAKLVKLFPPTAALIRKIKNLKTAQELITEVEGWKI